MLENFDVITRADESGFLAKLTNLPFSYEGPDGVRAEPYGLIAYGEASSLPLVLQSWVDAPVVVSGTQFLLASGFDFGQLAPFKISAELTQAEVVVLGHDAHEPVLRVEEGPLSVYTYAHYLGHATGHADALEQANAMMQALCDVVRPEVESDRNPAKLLAWSLLNRVPFVLTNKSNPGLSELVQRVFARVGKSLAVTTGDNPLEVLAGAFESRHQLGDDMVGLIVGIEDEEMKLAAEVLDTRVAQIERLGLPFGGTGAPLADAGANALVLWYLSMWVAAYLSKLHQLDPEDTGVYEELKLAASRR